jgi:hypothetical protein
VSPALVTTALCLLLAQPPGGPPFAGPAFEGALGGGALFNRYSQLSGLGLLAGAGAKLRQGFLLRAEYYRLKGPARQSPHDLSHAFLGLTLEKHLDGAHDRLFLGAGAGWSSLWVTSRPLPPPESVQLGEARHLSPGVMLLAGGEPWRPIGNVRLTLQARALAGYHWDSLHLSAAMLAGLSFY